MNKKQSMIGQVNKQRQKLLEIPMRIPVVTTREVFHLGSLDAGKKRRHFTTSLEGMCLSVSHCPHAWQSIAKLGGLSLWSMKKHHGVFIDVLAVGKDAILRQHIEAWGFENALVESQIRWRAWHTDEDGEWRYMLCSSKADALDEIECSGLDIEDGPDDRPAVEETCILAATKKLSDRLGFNHMDDMDAFDFLVMTWAEDTLPCVDGVWWRETYAPDLLSAPRGGIFPDRVATWSPQEERMSSIDDDVLEECITTDVLDLELPVKVAAMNDKFPMRFG